MRAAFACLPPLRELLVRLAAIAAVAAGVPLAFAPAAQAQDGEPRDLTYDVSDNPDFVCGGCGVFDSPYYLAEGEASYTAWNNSKNDAIAQATARGIDLDNSTYTWTKYKADERAGYSTITVGVQHVWARDRGGFLAVAYRAKISEGTIGLSHGERHLVLARIQGHHVR